MSTDLIKAQDLKVPRRIPEVLDRLYELQDTAEREPLGRRDGLASFNYLYTVITRNVQADYIAGDFLDGDFITMLDVAFANRYLSAVAGDAAVSPRPWQVLVQRRSDEWISPLIFAIAGVSAHVNFDLAFALFNTWEQRGIGATDFRDYQHLNDIFARQMQRLRDHLEDREERRFERRFELAPAENLLGDVTVFVARYLAWIRGKGLWRQRQDGDANARAERHLAAVVGMLNHCILAGNGALHRVFEALFDPSMDQGLPATGVQI